MDGPIDTPPRRSASVEAGSSKRKKTIRTYESSSKRSRTLAHDDQIRLSSSKVRGQAPQSTDQIPWLPPTLQADFAEHEPQMMFSEPSSTIPDNTMTQQRIIQQAIETANPSATVSTQNKSETQNSDSSIPWSAYKDAQAVIPLKVSPQTMDRATTPRAPSVELLSNGKKRSQTNTTANPSSHTPLRASHDKELGGDSQSPSKAPPTSLRSRRSKTMTPLNESATTVAPVALLSEIEVHDSPAKPTRRQSSSNADANQSKRRRRNSEVPTPIEPTSDELWVGMPKEQYKPRASRSRSARVTDDEYLQAVQQTLQPKSKTKRRKTTLETVEDDEKQLETLKEPTVPPSVSLQEKKPAGEEPAPVDIGQFGAAIDEADPEDANKENEAPDTLVKSTSAKILAPPSRPILVEVAIPAPASSKRKRTDEPESLTINGAAVESPVLKPTPLAPPTSTSWKKTKARRSQTAATPGFSQRRKVFDSDDESDPEMSPVKSFTSEKTTDMPPPPAPAAAGKKKGRGRPRKDGQPESSPSTAKSAKTSKSSLHVLDDEGQDFVPRDDEPLTMDDGHAEAAVPPISKVGDQATAVLEKPIFPPASTPEQQQKAAEASTKTPETKTKKSPTNHSPINKGKVPYRVGLSRRSRIAPLLRIIKK